MKIIHFSAVAFVALAIVSLTAALPWPHPDGRMTDDLRANVAENLRDTQADIDKLMAYVLNGTGKHQTYNRLAEFVDKFGSRISGSDNLNNALAWIVQQMQDTDNLDNAHGELAYVPKWVRGSESAVMLSPRYYPFPILGLGNSVGTPNITAPAIVVADYDDLSNQTALGNTQGKIIVFNQQCDWASDPVGCYGPSVDYRVNGASAAATAGGVACLVRSVTGTSLYTLHTGMQVYADNVTQIPVASITIEDVDMLQRMQDRGESIVLSISMDAKSYGNVPSMNVVGEIVGSTYPDEIVLVSGHIDSWDVGQGAMDDGGGALISWMTLAIFRQLGLTPKRTLRFVGWTCEEFGGIGAQQYYNDHQSNASNYSFVMESDLGTFTAQGIQFTGGDAATEILQQIVQYLAPINANNLTTGGGGEDIDPWQEVGVPGASLLNANDAYFNYHHSHADTMDVQDPDAMDSCLLTWAATAYAVANLDYMLPRGNSTATV